MFESLKTFCSPKAHAFDNSIFGMVEGVENEMVSLFDCEGRCLQTVRAAEGCTLEVPAAGIYMIQVGCTPARKVVVLK